MIRPESAWDPGPSITRHLGALIGERSPEAGEERLRRVETYVEAAFREFGLLARKEKITTARGGFHNVLGDLPAESSDSLFVVGAHIDAVPGTPGADDNASGVAVLLALAERFGGLPRSRSTVALRFAAFNLEEWGMVGSQDHAEGLKRSGRGVAGMISLEMVGYVTEGRQKYPPGLGFGRRKSGDFISVVGSSASKRLAGAVASALGAIPGLPVESLCLPVPAALLVGAALSDHSSFWRQGWPAVMVGDTAFYRNPHYHLPSDTLETVSVPFMEKVARGLGGFLEEVRERGAGLI